jgi:hypothetical protein
MHSVRDQLQQFTCSTAAEIALEQGDVRLSRDSDCLSLFYPERIHPMFEKAKQSPLHP